MGNADDGAAMEGIERFCLYRRQLGSLTRRRLPIPLGQSHTPSILLAIPRVGSSAASSNPFANTNRRRAPRNRVGNFNWRIPSITASGADPSHHSTTPTGGSPSRKRDSPSHGRPRCLSFLFDARHCHRMFARTSHASVTTSNRRPRRNRRRMEKRDPNKPTNHRLDCLVGSAVAASIFRGSNCSHRWRIRGGEGARQRVSFKELQVDESHILVLAFWDSRGKVKHDSCAEQQMEKDREPMGLQGSGGGKTSS